MRHPALLAVLIAGCALAAWAADTDGDGLPDDVEAALGSDISTPDRMTPVYEDGAKGEGDETVGADLEVAHDLLAVHFASLARGRTLWRLQFTEPWVVRGDVALIIYIDADNDKETGRQGGGHRGTDVMLRPRSASNHGLPATVLQASAAHGDSLYLTLDAPVNVEDGEVAMRAYVLIQNRENPADSDRTPWFEVRAPASDAEPVAVPESHSLYRAPEVIERIRVRVPMDEGGRRAIVTWITTWPTEAVVQYGRGSTFDAAVRHEQPEQNHRVVLEDLDPHSTYRCRIRCRSGTGEMISSDEVQFSTEFEEPDGSVARHRVPLRVVGAPGEARPVSQGVPFPRGALGSADHARVLDDAGAEVPSQVNVTSRWPDDTVKWLLLDFQADIPEGGEARYALEFGTEITRAEVPDPIAVTETEEAITVDTGALRVRFDRANFALLGEAWLGDERITDVEGAGIVLTDLDGERFTSLGPPDELFVSRRGPLHAVVTARGPHRSEGGEARYALEFGTEVTRAEVPDPLAVTATEEAITVDTGALKVRFDRANFALLGEAWLGDERITDVEGAGIVLTDLDGERFTSLGPPDELFVSRRGPLHIVITARGPHRSAGSEALFRYEVRAHFYAGLPMVRVFHTFENDRNEDLFTTIRSLNLRIPLAGGAGSAQIAGEDGVQTAAAGDRLTQYDDRRYIVSGATQDEGERAPGAMTVSGDRASAAIAVRNFWQLWPKSLEGDQQGATIGIMPELPEGAYEDIDPDLEDRLYYAVVDGDYKLHRGMSKTHEFTVRFDAEALEPTQEAELVNEPALAVAPPQWYADSKAFWHITPRVEGEFERYEAFADECLDAFLRKREQQREYGMLNFGDWWGERGFNWGNIEYDTQHGMMMQFARTGEREWFDNAMWAARHNIDVDVVQHGWQGHPAGVPFCHCLCHTGDYYPVDYRPSGIFGGHWNTGHLWTRGNLEYALMTGDERAWRIALQTANYLAGDLMVGYRMNRGAERATAWPLFGVMAAYHATGDEYYLNAARIITREVIREQNPEEGHWDIPAGYSNVTPTPIGGYAWCAGLLLTSLEMANEHLQDPELDRTFVKAAEWLAEEEWLPERRGFRACSCDSMNAAVTPGFECYRTPAAMLRAYELTGDRKFLDIAHIGFSYAVRRGGTGGKGGSTRLTLTPHAVYKLKQAGLTSLDTTRWEEQVRLRTGFVPVEPGEPVTVPVTVTSNRDHTLTVALGLRDLPGGWPAVEECTLELPPRSEATATFDLSAAAAMQPGESVALTLTVEPDGSDVLHRQVLLACPTEGGTGEAIGLVAGAEDFLGPALEQAGIETQPIEALGDLSAFGVIFLGTQAHTIDAAGLQEDFARLLQWVHGGGTLVVSQLNDDNWRPEFLPGTVLLDDANAVSGAIAAPDHPIFAGISSADALAGMIMYDTIAGAEGWRVLLRDEAGGPAIIATDPGAGRILAVMPSVERYYTGEASCADGERLASYRRLFGNIIAWALGGGD